MLLAVASTMKAGDPGLRAVLEALIEPGDALRIYSRTNVAHGDEGPATEWEIWDESRARLDRWWDFATSTWPRRVVFFTVLLPVGLVAAVVSIGGGAWLDRLIGGVTCVGPRGSRARQMQHSLSPLGGRGSHLAVTSGRLLVVKVSTSLWSRPPEVDLKWSAPMSQITSAERRPRGLLRRRVQLSFADGSRIIVALPLFDSPKPALVVAALTRSPPSR